jgi:hypothetical protein
MSQMLIDRELLQELLDAYFEFRADAQAYLGLQQHTAVRQRDSRPLNAFLQALDDEKKRQQPEIQGMRQRLQGTLAAGDDAAFLLALAALLGHR